MSVMSYLIPVAITAPAGTDTKPLETHLHKIWAEVVAKFLPMLEKEANTLIGRDGVGVGPVTGTVGQPQNITHTP